LGNLDLTIWQKWSLQKGKVNLVKYLSIRYSTWRKQFFGCMIGQLGPWIDLLFGIIGRAKLKNVKKFGN
jgi:hypothetical protein